MKKLALLPVAAIAAVAFATPAHAASSMPSSERVAVNASAAAKNFDANVMTMNVLVMQPSKGPAKCGTLTVAVDGIKKGAKDKGKSTGKSKGTSLPTR